MKKIIIAGGRGFNDYTLLKLKCDKILKDIPKDPIQIVSGGASGADSLGEKYAKERGYNVKRFEAEWDKYDKAAGVIRNKAMAEYSDFLIAFWNGFSTGTKNMIHEAAKLNLPTRIIKYR